jgi:hypothetical protein
MKAQKKSIVYSRACTIKAICREESDLNHVSLMATINLLVQGLKTLYLRMNKVAIKDSDVQLLASNLILYQMLKGYQNSASMDFDVRKILVSYCDNLRNARHDPTLPVFLIMDNCPYHNKQALLVLNAQYNIHVIWLLQHSSHFLQP